MKKKIYRYRIDWSKGIQVRNWFYAPRIARIHWWQETHLRELCDLVELF